MPENIEYCEIEEIKTNVICDPNLFNSIEIKNFILEEPQIISEIVIYDKNTDTIIPYTISDKCIYDGDINKINDYSLSQDAITVCSDTYILINLDGEFNINDVYIRVYITNREENNNMFTFSFLMNNHAVNKKDLPVETTHSCWLKNCRMVIESDDTWIVQIFFEDILYKYKYKLFKYYDLEKQYLDGYFTYKTDYFKDEQQTKIYYRYKKKNAIYNNENEINNNDNSEIKKFNEDSLVIKNNTNIEKLNNKDENLLELQIEETKELQNSEIQKVKVIKSFESEDDSFYKIFKKNIVIIGIILLFILIFCKILMHIIKKSRTK